MRRRTLLPVLAAFALALACAAPRDRAAAPAGSVPAHRIYVWSGDADHKAGESDFLAVVDADSASPTYAHVVATTPIGAGGTMPHHTEMQMPAEGRWLFANAFMTGRTYLFDFTDAMKPRVAAMLDSVPGMRMPHSYARLPDGNVVATLQFGDGKSKGNAGGLALFSPEGRLIRSASSVDPKFPGASIRTYSLDVSTASDRVITTSSPMDSESTTADVVQLWRLSDLKLLRTISFPRTAPDSTSRYPFEVRFFPDGKSAILNTFYCGYYYLSGLDGDAPTLEPVLALEQPRNLWCGVPLLVGKWWIMPIGRAHEFVVYDVSDPRRPRRASALAVDSTLYPHWLSREPGTNRIVATFEDSVPTVRVARFDSTSGTLSWDERFRETPGGPLGVSFDRAEWPHGRTGPAKPHGAVFSR